MPLLANSVRRSLRKQFVLLDLKTRQAVNDADELQAIATLILATLSHKGRGEEEIAATSLPPPRARADVLRSCSA